jgi:hypothetical protein
VTFIDQNYSLKSDWNQAAEFPISPFRDSFSLAAESRVRFVSSRFLPPMERHSIVLSSERKLCKMRQTWAN